MVPDVWLEDDDGEGDEDEVEAAEAVLERHEVEVRVGGGEVDLEVIGGHYGGRAPVGDPPGGHRYYYSPRRGTCASRRSPRRRPRGLTGGGSRVSGGRIPETERKECLSSARKSHKQNQKIKRLGSCYPNPVADTVET